MKKNLKCLIVDDSALSRKLVRLALESVPGVEVQGVAHDGLDALKRCEVNVPDVVTMDLEMPRMNGIQAVGELRKRYPSVKVLMVSSLTSSGAEATTQALTAGAFDFILKPVANDLNASVKTLSQQLESKLEAISLNSRAVGNRPQPTTSSLSNPRSRATAKLANAKSFSGTAKALCIGVSTGGPVALGSLIPALPADLPVPVFVVQHMPPVFTKSLADQLNRTSKLTVQEAETGMAAKPGHVYIAPGGKQMKLVASVPSPRIRITDDPPEANARPSVDYLFRSAAQVYGNRLAVAVLTGMGSDGLNGCQEVKRLGGRIYVQDESTCVVYGMPRVVKEAGLADEQLRLNDFAASLAQITMERYATCP